MGISSSLVHYYHKKGRLQRLGRGVYKNPKLGLGVGWPWEDLVIASKCVPQGVVCLISALAIHELTDEIPRQHWLALPHQTTAPNLPMARFVRMRNMELGKTKIKLGSEYISVFNSERSIVDAFRLLSLEIAIKALALGLKKRGAHKISLSKLRLYAQKQRIQIQPYIMAVTT